MKNTFIRAMADRWPKSAVQVKVSNKCRIGFNFAFLLEIFVITFPVCKCETMLSSLSSFKQKTFQVQVDIRELRSKWVLPRVERVTTNTFKLYQVREQLKLSKVNKRLGQTGYGEVFNYRCFTWKKSVYWKNSTR